VQYGAADEDQDSASKTSTGFINGEFKMREGFVGLKGDWGSSRLGRVTVPYKAVYASIDPWTDQVAQARQ
jgi:predicted porin